MAIALETMTLIGHQHYLLDDTSWNAFLKSNAHKISLLAFWLDEDYATMLLLDYDVPLRLSVKINLRRYHAVSKRYPSALWSEVMGRDLWGVEAIHAEDDVNFDQGAWNVTWPLSHGRLETKPKKILRPDKEKNGTLNIPFSQTGVAGLCDINLKIINDKMCNISVNLSCAHRGIIEQLIGKTKDEALPIIEGLSGGGFFAHPLAFIRAWEDAKNINTHEYERDQRLILLEIERITLHLYDLGQMAHHGEKELLSSFCFYMREKLADIFEKYGLPRRLTRLFSHQYHYDLFALCKELLTFMEKHFKELSSLYDFFSMNFNAIGILSTENAWLYGIGGIVGRASGRIVDMRRRDQGMRLDALRAMSEYKGCTAARGKQRLGEIRDSLSLIKMILEHFGFSNADTPHEHTDKNSNSNILHDILNDNLNDNLSDGLAVVESARGDIWYWVRLKEDRIEKIFIRDPNLPLYSALKEIIEGEAPKNLSLILSSLGLAPAAAAL